jgi:hypothetical protein
MIHDVMMILVTGWMHVRRRPYVSRLCDTLSILSYKMPRSISCMGIGKLKEAAKVN